MVVYAVEFASSSRWGHAMHRAVPVGEYPDCDAALAGIEAAREAHPGNGTAEYLGFFVWPAAGPEGPPREIWLDWDP
jgi:hypothetical protein